MESERCVFRGSTRKRRPGRLEGNPIVRLWEQREAQGRQSAGHTQSLGQSGF